jgi:hypothetical protein
MAKKFVTLIDIGNRAVTINVDRICFMKSFNDENTVIVFDKENSITVKGILQDVQAAIYGD